MTDETKEMFVLLINGKINQYQAVHFITINLAQMLYEYPDYPVQPNGLFLADNGCIEGLVHHVDSKNRQHMTVYVEAYPGDIEITMRSDGGRLTNDIAKEIADIVPGLSYGGVR